MNPDDGADPPALDHGLAYQALAKGQVNLIDVYSTDAQIGRLGLRVLKDDRGFFPRYDAVWLMRSSLPAAAQAALAQLEGRIDEATMIALNAEVELDGRPFAEVARGFLDRSAKASTLAAPSGRHSLIDMILAPDLSRLLLQHLLLVFGSVLLAVAVGVPLGIAIAGANAHDQKLVAETLASVPEFRSRSQRRRKPHLCLDKGYYGAPVRRIVARYGYRLHLPPRDGQPTTRRKGRRARRWVVERVHSWTNRARRLLVRWEKKVVNYLAFVHLQFAYIALNAAGVLG